MRIIIFRTQEILLEKT